MNKKALVSGLIICLLMGVLALPYVRAQTEIKKIKEYPLTEKDLEKIESYEIKVYKIKASSDLEYGEKVGRMYAPIIKLLPSFAPIGLKGMDMPLPSPEHVSYVKTDYPELFERLEGIEASTGVRPEQLILLGMAFDAFLGKLGAGCTTSASAPPATIGDEVFLTWNMDFSYIAKMALPNIISSPEVDAPEMLGIPIFFIRDIKGHNKVFCLGLPGILEMPVLNDKGLAFVGNAVAMKDEGPGLSDIELINKIMDRCSTVEEAAEIIEDSPRFTSSAMSLCNLNYLFGDEKGGIASIEATHQYFAVRYGKETQGILAQANHHQWLDYHLTGAPPSNRAPYGYRSSWIRATRMWELLEENKGKITLEKAMSFTADTANGPEGDKGGYDSICRYGIRDGAEKIPEAPKLFQTDSTMFALVIQPKERIIWYCGAHPDEAPYMKIDVGAIFAQG
jgi:hypothetical protein